MMTIHSETVGLDTPYLSKEWFDCINACVDEAKKVKMNAWLYDEDCWPSGAAGGLVTKNPTKCAPGDGGFGTGEFRPGGGFGVRKADQLRQVFDQSLRRQVLAAVSAVVGGAMLMSGCSTNSKRSGSATHALPPVFAIPRLPAVVVDGAASDWADGGLRIEALITEPGTMPGQGPQPARQDFAAAMRLGWNESGLLVLLDVTGRDWREGEKADELFAGDSVEFYLAAHPGAANRCQWVVAPGMDTRFPEPRVRLVDYATSPWLRPTAPLPVVARRKTETGYRLEALLPWAALRLTPGPGLETAFQAMVNSHDRNGRPADHLLWFPMVGAAHDSRRTHRIRLAEEAGPPVTARAAVRVDFREFKTTGEVFAPLSAEGQEVRLRASGGVLAAGWLAAAGNGFATATLSGPGTEDPVVCLEVNGRASDSVPLILPRAQMAIETQVRLASVPGGLAVIIGLPPASPPGYRVARRRPGETWQVLAVDVAAGEFRDTTVKPETLYEYEISRGGDEPSVDYFWSGSAIPLRDRRGTALLLVERSQAQPLAPEIRRLMFDLVGDGWKVVRRDVAATQTVAEVRGLIRGEYDRAPGEVKTVLLLGQIPVPYAGHSRPDGHGPGAWPADVCYGAMEGAWTDDMTNGAGNRRQNESAPDGKFDQSAIPGPVQLAVGRMDFSRMPAFGADETTLLRRYLDRNHAYRHALLAVADRAFVHDGFLGHEERFAADGWQNFTTLLDPENVRAAVWPNVRPGMNLFWYACGPGHPDNVQGFGGIRDLVKTPLEGIFTLFFGSCIGDWNTPDNMMRATLAHERGALTCGWAGRPHWYLHSMGMGETIGDGLVRTQNNDGRDYKPAGSRARGTHVALLGDPTLRLHPVAPPAELRVQAAGQGARLSWTASPQQVMGYHVYRADAEFGPYERITKEPLKGRSALDPASTPAHYYQIRAVALRESTTGTYYNSSQGVFAGPPASQ